MRKERMATVAIVLAFAMALVGCGGGGRSVDASWPVSGVAVPASSSQPGVQSAGVPAATADYKAYRLFEVADPVFSDMPALRTLVPDGWTASGAVEWSCDSARAPAQVWLRAASADEQATLALFTEEWYGVARIEGAPADVWGFPRREPYDAEQAVRDYLSAIGATDISLESKIDWSNNKLSWPLFEAMLKQDGQNLMELGIELQDPYYDSCLLEGSAMVTGHPVDVRADATVWGYTAFADAAHSANCYGTKDFALMLAPQGQMGKYLSDLQDIRASASVNHRWTIGTLAVKDALFALLEGAPLTSWEAARQQCVGFAAQVDAGMDHGILWEYRTGALRQNRSELWPVDVTEQANYHTGDGGTITVPSTWSHAWLGDDGSVYLSNDPALFDDPAAGPGTAASYTALSPVEGL